MILFLSASFLKRLHFIWQPDLKAFLVGERNLFFFTPDTPVPTQNLSPQTIDEFLKNAEGHGQLLGFLSNEEVLPQAGYIYIETGNSSDIAKWKAGVFLYEEATIKKAPLEIRTTG